MLRVYKLWNARVSTGLLNDWLRKVTQISANDYENVLIQKVLLKIRYIVQSKTRPPTFVLFVNDKHLFKANILKFIRNSLIKEFKLMGVAIKLIIKERHEFKFAGIHKISSERSAKYK